MREVHEMSSFHHGNSHSTLATEKLLLTACLPDTRFPVATRGYIPMANNNVGIRLHLGGEANVQIDTSFPLIPEYTSPPPD